MNCVRWQSTLKKNGSRAAHLYMEDVVAIGSLGGNTMKNKALAFQSILEMTENRAKWCQVSGHSPFSHARIGPQDRKVRGGLLMTSRPCLILVFFLGLTCRARG